MNYTFANFDYLPSAERLERWKNAKRVLTNLSPHEREDHWLMSTWGRQTRCGTVACAAGHCGLDPWFRELGFKLDFDSYGHSLFVNEDSVTAFFGYNDIFFNGDERSVDCVIDEIENHILFLKGEEDL